MIKLISLFIGSSRDFKYLLIILFSPVQIERLKLVCGRVEQEKKAIA